MTSPSADAEMSEGAGRLEWIALSVLCAAFFMAVLDSTSVFAALPSIATDLGLSDAAAQWVITAYALAVGGLLLLGGRTADLVGKRRTFLWAVGVFGVASLLGGLAWSGGVLILARVLQGVGAAALTPAALALLMIVFPDGPDRNRALGIWGGLGGIGATVGVLLGGALTEAAGWPWIFFVNVPVCVAIMAVSPRLLPRGQAVGGRGSFDLAGAATVTAALMCLLLALFAIAGDSPASSYVSALLVAAVGFGITFVVLESRSADPLVPLRILRTRMLAGGASVILLAGVGVDGMFILVTMYTQRVLEYTALQFGLAMTVMTVASIVGVWAGQHIVTRCGVRVVAAVGMALLVLACLLLSTAPIDGTFARDLLPGLLLFGLGMGGGFVAAQIAALSRVRSGDAGLASGIVETAFSVGTTLGVALASAVAISRSGALIDEGVDVALARTEGYGAAFLVLGAVTAVGFLIATLSLTATRTDGLSNSQA